MATFKAPLFNIGDVIAPLDHEYEYGTVRTNDSYIYGIERNDKRPGGGELYKGKTLWVECESEIRLLGRKEVKKHMALNAIQEANLTDDIKTLIKAGVLQSDLTINDSTFVLNYLVQANLKGLVAAAQTRLDEMEKEKQRMDE